MARSTVLTGLRSLLALDIKLPSGHCLTHIGREGCADYRAALHLDRPLDAADRSAGRRIACPVLVLWGDREGALADGPLEVWRRWASDVRGHSLPCGHFLPEEAPEALAAALEAFLAGGR